MNQSLNNIMTTSDRKRGVVVKGEGLRMDDSQVHLVPLSCRKQEEGGKRMRENGDGMSTEMGYVLLRSGERSSFSQKKMGDGMINLI